MLRVPVITTVYMVMLLAMSSLYAQDDDLSDESLSADEPATQEDRGRHRLDVSAIYIDSLLFESLAFEVGYSFSLTEKTIISASATYMDADLGVQAGEGFGDTTFAFSWAPLTRVSVEPWMPKRFGTGIAVTVPTGNEDDLRSLGTTIVTPYVGLVLPVSESFSLLPSMGYLHSLDENLLGDDMRLGIVDLGINWVSNRSFWITLYGAFLWDFETDEEYYNTQLSIGAIFSPRWGASLDWAGTDYFTPGRLPIFEDVIDGQVSLSIYFNF